MVSRIGPVRLSVDRGREGVGLPLVAPAREVRAGVVDEHVERGRATRPAASIDAGSVISSLVVGEAASRSVS